MCVPFIVGVYLGAGKSIRMGRNKLNLPFKDFYLGSSAFQAALDSKLKWTIAVTRQGDSLQWLSPFSKKERWSMLQCRNAENGQSVSLKAGVKAANSLGAEAVLVLLADQPMVSSKIINQLVDEYREPYTTASTNGVNMPPIIISHTLFPSLMGLTGDSGGRKLLQERKIEGKALEFDSGILVDIDTKEDYENFLNFRREKN